MCFAVIVCRFQVMLASKDSQIVSESFQDILGQSLLFVDDSS
jgi:hypothetical protein